MHPKATLESLGIRARKSLSQNFLTSPHWAEKLVAKALEGKDSTEVWEIGPGLGALTSVLLQQSKLPVRAFEYDRALSAYLRVTFPQLDLTEGDFLDVDLAAKLTAGMKVSLLSNVPYHLSSPLLFGFIPYRHFFTQFVMTFQREFAERLSAKPRTSHYAGLTVMVQTFFSVESVGILPPGAFYPVPDVDSQALLLIPRPEAPKNFPAFEKLIRAAFAHRRKKLSSNLKALFPGHDIEKMIVDLGHPPLARPEELSREQYLRLGQLLDSV